MVGYQDTYDISYKTLSARLAISVRMLNITFKPINKKWTMEDLLRMHNTQGIAWIADFVRFTIQLYRKSKKGFFVADASGAFTHAQLMCNSMSGNDCESFQNSDFFTNNIQDEAPYAIEVSPRPSLSSDHSLTLLEVECQKSLERNTIRR